MSDAPVADADGRGDRDGDADTGDGEAAALVAAAERLRDAEADLASFGDGADADASPTGAAAATAVADAHERAHALLDRYEDRATGTGDFEAYVEFQDAFLELVEDLPDHLPRRDAFESANDALDKRRLSASDFERARDALAPAEHAADLLAAREDARESYRDARRAAAVRREAVADRIAELDRLRSLGEADVDAPVERLRDPVEAYDDAARDAFATFRAETSAREVFSLIETTAAYPLVPFRQPPPELRAYLADAPAGEEPVPRLLEYAGYSRSKLDHYLDDPGRFSTRVPVHRTYLERLDAEPLTVSWPPPEAGTLRYRARELVSVLGRFAPDGVVARARELRDLAADDEYGRLRRAAAARAELTDRERARLADGAVEAELAALRDERDRLAAALDEHPPLAERDGV